MKKTIYVCDECKKEAEYVLVAKISVNKQSCYAAATNGFSPTEKLFECCSKRCLSDSISTWLLASRQIPETKEKEIG